MSIYKRAHNQTVSHKQAENVTSCHGLGLGRSVVHCLLRAVNQQPSTSSAMSRLRSSSVDVWMWRASFSWSFLGLLARSSPWCPATWWDGGAPRHVLPQLTSPAFPCSKHLGVLSFLSQVSWTSPQCRSSHSCRGSGRQPWTASLLAVCPQIWSRQTWGISQFWRPPSGQTSSRLAWCPRWYLRHKGASPVGVATCQCPLVPFLRQQSTGWVVAGQRSEWRHQGSHFALRRWQCGAILGWNFLVSWWCSWPCHVSIWPGPSWHGEGGGIGSPSSGRCAWASCTPWRQGCHHPSTGAGCLGKGRERHTRAHSLSPPKPPPYSYCKRDTRPLQAHVKGVKWIEPGSNSLSNGPYERGLWSSLWLISSSIPYFHIWICELLCNGRYFFENLFMVVQRHNHEQVGMLVGMQQ